MEPVTIIALITAGLGVLTTGGLLGKRIFDKFKKRTADNEEKWYTFKGAKELIEDGISIWGEEKDNIEELISQVMVASKAIDKQKSAVEKIDQNKALRDKLAEAAAELGPEAMDALSDVLTPVPKDFVMYGGAHLDKLSRIKEAQREELGKKEAFNKVLERSGEMAKKMVEAAKALAKLQG